MKIGGKENKERCKARKKAQEEMMGFVVIILIVIIIGFVFFAFSLRKHTTTEQKQAELDDLLNSILAYTTACEINSQNQTIRELIRQCNNNPSRNCNNENVCVYLNDTLEDILSKLLGSGTQIAQAYVHGYVLNITGSEGQLTYIAKGNLSGNYFASNIFVPTLEGKDIEIKLRYYYSKE